MRRFWRKHVKVFDKYFAEERSVNGRIDINGNQMRTAYEILTGNDGWNHFYAESSLMDKWINGDKITQERIDKFNDKNHIVCVASSANEDIKLHASDGSDAVLIGHHAYAVSRADKNYVYLINPWNTSTEIKVDIKTFTSFFNDLQDIDL